MQMTYQANLNWKRAFVREINHHGAGVGSLLRVHKDSYNEAFLPDTGWEIGMVVGYDYTNTNVFCGLGGYSTYQSNSSFKVLVGNETYNINLKHLSNLLEHDLLERGWWITQTPTVLSPVKWEPPSEWLHQEYDEVMNWFFKDVNKERDEKSGLYGFLENWANKF